MHGLVLSVSMLMGKTACLRAAWISGSSWRSGETPRIQKRRPATCTWEVAVLPLNDVGGGAENGGAEPRRQDDTVQYLVTPSVATVLRNVLQDGLQVVPIGNRVVVEIKGARCGPRPYRPPVVPECLSREFLNRMNHL